MPAGGDNKPKIQQAISKLVASVVKANEKCGSLCVALATILVFVSFIFGCFLAIQPGVSFAILIPDLLLFVSSIYYLSRKI